MQSYNLYCRANCSTNSSPISWANQLIVSCHKVKIQLDTITHISMVVTARYKMLWVCWYPFLWRLFDSKLWDSSSNIHNGDFGIYDVMERPSCNYDLIFFFISLFFTMAPHFIASNSLNKGFLKCSRVYTIGFLYKIDRMAPCIYQCYYSVFTLIELIVVQLRKRSLGYQLISELIEQEKLIILRDIGLEKPRKV